MDDIFKIWIDRLKANQTLHIDESFPSEFLDIQETELKMDTPVQIKGEAYTSEGELILHLSASTKGSMSCAVCNQMTEFDLKIQDFYHAVPLTEIPSACFDMREPLREALLLELPKFVECNRGKCPEREVISPYLRKEEDKSHYPFSNLDSEET